jgi:hypothetical protein
VFPVRYELNFYIVFRRNSVFKGLKGMLSAEYHEITKFLVKKCINYVKKPLAHIFNSFSSGTFPDRLKLATVIPLHKKGEHHNIKNYRPISILSAFSKILQKLMYNRLMPFLTLPERMTNISAKTYLNIPGMLVMLCSLCTAEGRSSQYRSYSVFFEH